MSNSDLKIIAIGSMLIDHIGAILFPNIIVFRMFGRLAFPIFAFLLVEGFFRTQNAKMYLTRLGMYALLAEIPFDLAVKGVWFELTHQNIFFTLFLGLSAIMIYDRYKDTKRLPSYIFVAAIAVISIGIGADYGVLGIATIFIFYLYRDEKSRALISVAGLHIFYGISVAYGVPSGFVWPNAIQALAAVSMLFIARYNGQRGLGLKYTFYLFYPAHLLVLYGISRLMAAV